MKGGIMSKRHIAVGLSLAAFIGFFTALKMRRKKRREDALEMAWKAAPEWLQRRMRAIERLVMRSRRWAEIPLEVKMEFLKQLRKEEIGKEILGSKRGEPLSVGFSRKIHGYSCYLTIHFLPIFIPPKQ